MKYKVKVTVLDKKLIVFVFIYMYNMLKESL